MSPELLRNYLALLPEIALVVMIIVIFAYERHLAPENRRQLGLVSAWGAFVILLATLGLWYFAGIPDLNTSNSIGETLIWGGMMRNDGFTLVFRIMFLMALGLTSLISMDVKSLQRGEFYILLHVATIGFSLMAAAADLIMLYVALETASLSLYVMVGFVTSSPRSTEGGMKYFVYGAFASALMLYGLSLIYGMTGQTNIYAIAQGVLNGGLQVAELNFNNAFLVAAILILAGFAFKVSAVPFHFWTPDAYEGAPTPVTAFLSTASKAAGFAVLFRVFSIGMLGAPVPDRSNAWWTILVAMCIVTMTLGNMLAIYQSSIKRMLAYSSIAQAGYIIVGLVTFTADGLGAAMFYLFMYVLTNITAFGVVVLFDNQTGTDDLKAYSGLSRRSPYLALAMMLALLSLGGIPPTAGFIAKFLLFRAAVDAGLWWLALIGIVNAFIALYYYLSVLKYLYLYRSEEEEIGIPSPRAATVALLFSSLGIIILGTVAAPLIEWTQRAAAAFLG
ncbi:MAG: NADH-quinone oxidoreductase subunit N [Chloroflexi bacterium]|nr:NADH-quinone oxidoreductase subunit N [Chloroflexota bacterium]MBP8056593.1 NADH-quinone oxidoreductase subunit N [Chloroflexota bacterium]